MAHDLEKQVSRSTYNALLDGSMNSFYTCENWKRGQVILLREYDYKRQKLTGSEMVVKVYNADLKPIYAIEVVTVIL
jgi:hypothetical protein